MGRRAAGVLRPGRRGHAGRPAPRLGPRSPHLPDRRAAHRRAGHPGVGAGAAGLRRHPRPADARTSRSAATRAGSTSSSGSSASSEKVVVVGHSFGGGVAIRFAHDHPDRVRSLVLVNSIGGSAWRRGRTLTLHRRAAAVGLGPALPGRHLPAAPGHPGAPGDPEDAVPNMMRNPRSIVRVANLARRADLRSELEELKRRGMPVTVLWGNRDGIIPKESFEAHVRGRRRRGPGHRRHPLVAAGRSGRVRRGHHQRPRGGQARPRAGGGRAAPASTVPPAAEGRELPSLNRCRLALAARSSVGALGRSVLRRHPRCASAGSYSLRSTIGAARDGRRTAAALRRRSRSGAGQAGAGDAQVAAAAGDAAGVAARWPSGQRRACGSCRRRRGSRTREALGLRRPAATAATPAAASTAEARTRRRRARPPGPRRASSRSSARSTPSGPGGEKPPASSAARNGWSASGSAVPVTTARPAATTDAGRASGRQARSRSSSAATSRPSGPAAATRSASAAAIASTTAGGHDPRAERRGPAARRSATASSSARDPAPLGDHPVDRAVRPGLRRRQHGRDVEHLAAADGLGAAALAQHVAVAGQRAAAGVARWSRTSPGRPGRIERPRRAPGPAPGCSPEPM